MVAGNQQIVVEVMANKGSVRSDKAVSIGLIVTELVINAIKYAFPAGHLDSKILVTYKIDDQDWKLIVSDNGIGKGGVGAVEATGGLGTAIIEALVRQLDARMDVASNSSGTKVSITRATFTSRMPYAA